MTMAWHVYRVLFRMGVIARYDRIKKMLCAVSSYVTITHTFSFRVVQVAGREHVS